MIKHLLQNSKATLIAMLLVLISSSVYSMEYYKSYDIQMFNQDQVIMGPVGSLSGFYEIVPAILITEGSFVEICYTNSQMIRSDISFMTLSLNGNPLSSVKINASVPDSNVWRVQLPVKYFKNGYNEIKLITLQRTTDDPCTDLYNNANWVKIKMLSNLHINMKVTDPLAINTYPYPYLDLISNAPVNCRFNMAPGFDSKDVELLLRLASDWGGKAPFKPIDIKFNTSSEQFSDNNQIFIGEESKFPWLNNQPSGNETGFISQSSLGSLQYFDLVITGQDKTGVKKSAYALLSPEKVAQMNESNAKITRLETEDELKKNYPKEGIFTLKDIGLPQISLEGIFTQRYKMTITRPLKMNPSLDSYIKLYFYHSENLDKKQSLLTVVINGLPAGSVDLSPENSKGGELLIKVPESELEKPLWLIEFSAYHFLGSVEDVDCTYDYDAAAWTVIEGRSEINIAPGNMDMRPLLQNYPQLVFADISSWEKIYFWLPAKPTDEQITLAAIIAARAGQNIKNNIDFNVVMSDNLDDKIKNEADVLFVLGYPQDQQRWETFKEGLLIKPNSAGGFLVDKRLKVINENLSKMSILEAAPSPWNSRGTVFTIIPNDNEGVDNIIKVLNSPEKSVLIDGNVSLILKDNKVIPLKILEPITPVKKITNPFKNLPLRYILTGLVIIAILAYLLYRVIKSRRAKRKTI